MDKNTQLFQYNLDWKTFQRVLYYTKKYYGMDALYFYEANPFGKSSVSCPLKPSDSAPLC